MAYLFVAAGTGAMTGAVVNALAGAHSGIVTALGIGSVLCFYIATLLPSND